MRLFVAVDVPSSLKEELDRTVCEPLRPCFPDGRWTRPEGRHLTLKFLGEVPSERVEDIGVALAHAVSGHRRFTAGFERAGGFPNLRRPRVVWVGLGEGAEPMAALAADVDRSLEPLGFEAEKRPFTGHLTLCRIKVPKRVDAVPEVEVPADGFEVRDVVLFRSQLNPKGARYTALKRFALGG
jgi:2'-5' RNA ligase